MQKWCECHRTRRDLQQTPGPDPHCCCWSQTAGAGTKESSRSDVNTTDWWRTVKLPFVKEKQEASCGRPSLSGWEETAGRKPHLQMSERLNSALGSHSWLSASIRLTFWPEHSPSSFHYHYFNTCIKVNIKFFFLSLVGKISATLRLIIPAACPFAAVPRNKSCVLEEGFSWFTTRNATSWVFFFSNLFFVFLFFFFFVLQQRR